MGQRADIITARGIDNDGGNIAHLQAGQRLRIFQQEARFPEWMLEPVAFELVDEHPQFDIGNTDLLQHGPRFRKNRMRCARAR